MSDVIISQENDSIKSKIKMPCYIYSESGYNFDKMTEDVNRYLNTNFKRNELVFEFVNGKYKISIKQ